MANENTPLFALPSLEQYQQAMKAQDAEGMNLLQRRALDSSYDFARQLGYRSPAERKVEAANQVMAQAQLGEDETDPLKRQYNVLVKAARSFNDLGMTDYVQQIAPELARLKNQQLEQDKLIADAEHTKAETIGNKLANVKNALTMDADVDKAIAEGTKAGLEMKPWVNQDTGRFMAVNVADPKSIQTALDGQFVPYVPGQGADKAALGTKVTGDLQGDVIKADTLLIKLRDNVTKFDPRYLTIGGRLEAAFSNAKEMAGMNLSKEEQSFLADMTSWQRSSFEVMNQYIHDMTGAQMSQFETYRLVKGIPDPTRDAGTKYMAKLKDLVRATLAVKKYKQNLLVSGKPQDTGWQNPDNLPYVRDEEVDQFLGSAFHVTPDQMKPTAPKARSKEDVLSQF